MTDFEPLTSDAGDPSVAATGTKARRQTPQSTRRILLIVLGVLVMAGSVTGFYLTSDAFDKRTPVLVSAVDIQQGEEVSAGLFTSSLAVMGSIPHIPYTPDAPYAFEGFIAKQPIPAGTVVLGAMMLPPEGQPIGNELEVTVQFDTSLATTELYDGDRVLLVDPGREPTAEDPGRPQQALQALTLRNYQSGSMTMFLEPEEWAVWKDLPADFGALPQLLPVPTGGIAEEFGQQVNVVWLSEWERKAAAIAEASPPEGPTAGPGELEVVVALDTSLAPSGVSEGSNVLLIDPGLPPTSEELGRPRKVLRTLRLENFDGTAMRLFVPPEQWVQWQKLSDDLGASPMVLPIPDGTDVDEMVQRLNIEWEGQWDIAVIDLTTG